MFTLLYIAGVMEFSASITHACALQDWWQMVLLGESEGLSSITDVSYLGTDMLISLSQSNPLSSPQCLWDGSYVCICICICTNPQYWWLCTRPWPNLLFLSPILLFFFAQIIYPFCFLLYPFCF